jgi:hypothetical protein
MWDDENHYENKIYFIGYANYSIIPTPGLRLTIQALTDYALPEGENYIYYVSINSSDSYPIGLRTSTINNDIEFGQINLFANQPTEIMLINHPIHGYCWVVTDYYKI